MRQRRVGYVERPPVPALAAHVACLWTQSVTDGPPYVHRVVPDGCVDIIWQNGTLHVAGPDTGPFLATLDPGSRLIGLRFRPGAAPPLLGLPTSELRDCRVDVDELWGPEVGRLAERLAGAPDTTTGTRVLEREIASRLLRAESPDPMAGAVVAELRRPDPVSVAGLAERLGVSERQLRRRCVAAFGYGPKTLERVLRFHRAVCLVRAGRSASLAVLAADLGYADQSHLAREVRLLAGVPLSGLAGSQTERSP